MVRLSKVGISVPFHLAALKDSPSAKEMGGSSSQSGEKRPRPTNGHADYFENQKIRRMDGSLQYAARVSSVPALSSFSGEASSLPLRKRMKRSQSSVFLVIQSKNVEDGNNAPLSNIALNTKPEMYFNSILERFGASMEDTQVDPNSFLSIENQQHSSYPRAAMAARNEDLELLRKLHNDGQTLQCANKFGESIIHIVCRRSRDDILDFLVGEAGVSLRLMDDLGRTPLHDAAWTDKPNFKVATQLLMAEPDLIYARDKRGNSPLAYIPKQNWGLWNAFLEDNKNLILRSQKGMGRVVG